MRLVKWSLNSRCSNVGKTRNKSRSEVEWLRGRNRQLEAELKYFKKREHFFNKQLEPVEEVQNVKINECKECGKGVVIEYDFLHGILKKCDVCDNQEYKKKKT